MVLASHSSVTYSSLRRGVQLICCRENDCTTTMPGFAHMGSEEHTQPLLSAQPTRDVGDGSEQRGSSRRNIPPCPPALCSEIRLGLSTNNANSSWVLTCQHSTNLKVRDWTSLSLKQPKNTRILFPDLRVNICFSNVTKGERKPTRAACRGRKPFPLLSHRATTQPFFPTAPAPVPARTSHYLCY